MPAVEEPIVMMMQNQISIGVASTAINEIGHVGNSHQHSSMSWKDMADSFFRKIRRPASVSAAVTTRNKEDEVKIYKEISKGKKGDETLRNSKAENDLARLQEINQKSNARMVDYIQHICNSLLGSLKPVEDELQNKHLYTTTSAFYCPNRIRPLITLEAYMNRMIKGINKMHAEHDQTSIDSLGFRAFIISSMIYYPRLSKMNESFELNELNVHRILMIGMVLAVKMFEDDHVRNSSFAKLGGVPLAELNNLEIQYCKYMRFEFGISLMELELSVSNCGAASAA